MESHLVAVHNLDTAKSNPKVYCSFSPPRSLQLRSQWLKMNPPLLLRTQNESVYPLLEPELLALLAPLSQQREAKG